jgi:hypothetical protein
MAHRVIACKSNRERCPPIRRATPDRFTIDRLMGVLSKLDQQVEVEVRVVERAV